MCSIKIFSLLIILSIFQDILGNGYLKSDYYESLSNSKQCLIVSHYYPSGPLFLFAIFKYNLSSFIYGYESKIYSFNSCFKKTEKICKNTVFVTTIVKDFIKCDLIIEIYIFKNSARLTIIRYFLHKNIPTGHHELWDIYKLFSIHVKIFDDIKEYSLTSKCELKEIETDLNLVSKNTEYFCLLSKNKVVVLKPSYIRPEPEGLITEIIAYIFQNGIYIFNYTYSAFNCNKTKNYPNKRAVFIIDYFKLHINYKVKAWKYYKGILNEEEHEFKIYNISYQHVNYMKYIPKKYITVFLLRFRRIDIQCQDGTKRQKFLSSNGITFYISEFRKVNISLSLEQIIIISHPIMGIC